MKIIIKKSTSCIDCLKCSDDIRKKIEEKYAGLKLSAKNKTDTVNGSITIRHQENNHEIILRLYDKDEKPNNNHESTFKKYSKLNDITEKEIKKII